MAELRATIISNLRRFPRIGRRYLANPPQSAEALTQLAALPAGAPDALREYLHGDYPMLYAATEADAAVCLLSIRHHRQLLLISPSCGLGRRAHLYFAGESPASSLQLNESRSEIH